jgi:hypothetical protein
MARIRTIKPQFFLNEELAEQPAMTRLLFIGLWTQADREGRLIDRPKRLKAEIFPYDNFDIEKGLKQLSDAKFILRYKANVNVSDRVLAPEQPINELALIQIINFSKHQKIDKHNEKESDLPPPLPQDYLKSIGSLPKDGEGKGKEGKGKEPPDDPATTAYTKGELELFKQVEDWILQNAPTVAKMKEPLRIDQFLRLKERFPDRGFIRKILLAMHNWKKLKERQSAFLTFLSFAEKEETKVA